VIPAVFDGFADVLLKFVRFAEFVEQDAMMEPRNLCSKLLHKLLIRPGFGKGA